MAELGSISKLLDQRIATFKAQTNEIFSKISDRLTLTFQTIYEAPHRRIIWTSVESLIGSNKTIIVSGYMALELGDIVTVDDNKITIDETNINEYSKLIKFAFPIIMLELATVEELVEHMQRMGKISSAMEVSAEALATMMDKIADAYENQLLNDPTKVTVFDAATKPTTIMGFSATELSDEQIRKLKLIERLDVGLVN